MAKVIPIGQPVNDSERQAIAFLRDRLPETWLVFHNFEMRQGLEVFEIDLAVLSPHAIYLIDVKGTTGNIDVYGSKWYPEGRQPFHSPLAKLRSHAKMLASAIRDSNAGLPELRKVHVQAVVLLTAINANLHDPEGRDGPDVTDIKNCLKYLNDTNRIPSGRLTNISRFHHSIAKAIVGRAQARNTAQVFGDWQVEESLGGTDRYMEYRAKHSLVGKSGGMVRLRVYKADPYQDTVDRENEFKKISNAYTAVANLPTHENILAVKNLFFNESEDRIILVTEDVPGQALRLYLNKPSLALTFDQKLQVIRDILSALDHAHHYEVIHRNLSPDCIMVMTGGQARITGFDFARVGKDRTSTIADQIIDDLNQAYQAPECYQDPSQASIASDLFSAGLVFFELLTGDLPYESVDQMLEADGKFPVKPSEHKPDLPEGIDEWLQLFCEFDPEDRHISAAVARKALDRIILPEDQEADESIPGQYVLPNDLTDLPMDFLLGNRFRIQKKLGSGGFGVAYKVFDAFGDVERVIKLVTKDRSSVYERLRREYKTLVNLPDHPHVVKVVWADRLMDANQTPFIVFEYVDGLDVSDLINGGALSLEDSVRILRETADGLAHLHEHGTYHQDIKPSNLIWTEQGIRIIDFNVAVTENDDSSGKGGTRRYLPPDYDHSKESEVSDLIDRDLYALGITFYECLTGTYPFKDPTPPIKVKPKDPTTFQGCSDLTDSVVNLVYKIIAPERSDRFISAQEILRTLDNIVQYRNTFSSDNLSNNRASTTSLDFKSNVPNTNPFVRHMLTLYSQSQVSNAGTRGLDAIGKATYVSTYLDEKLQPALLEGKFKLAIISGNAGDGKTAFVQQFEKYAESKGANIKRHRNGAVFKIKDHTFQSNYDGSQDEGSDKNDTVLMNFFGPFSGNDPSKWPKKQTRIIAINEGRLVDFFLEHEEEFPLLSREIGRGFSGETTEHSVVIINLNLRSVVANMGDNQLSIMERLIHKMTDNKYWESCENCDIRHKCYVFHNIKTFQDPVAGAKVTERLKMLYTITHLRGRLHITMRDLRSAMSYMLVGVYDCHEIHQLYRIGGADNLKRIINSFYFNSWLGGIDITNDRLLLLLKEIDIAKASNPAMDRKLGFMHPKLNAATRFQFDDRPNYEQSLLESIFEELPRDYSSKNRTYLIEKHREYVAYARRRFYFERRDDGWWQMLPYGSLKRFISAVGQPGQKSKHETEEIIKAINRGEGLLDPSRLGNRLVLRVRTVDKGTIRSYRLFDGTGFFLTTEQETETNQFIEFLPQALLLYYTSDEDRKAQLKINLDIYEMLMRLNDGYQPSLEEEEGFYISLAVFKNVLSAASYQEILLTERGYTFYNIKRDPDGTLTASKMGGNDNE